MLGPGRRAKTTERGAVRYEMVPQHLRPPAAWSSNTPPMTKRPGIPRAAGQEVSTEDGSQALSSVCSGSSHPPPVAWPSNFSLSVSTAHSAADRLSNSCPACPLQRGPRPPTLHPLHHIPPHLPLSTHSPPASSLPAVGSSGLCPWT